MRGGKPLGHVVEERRQLGGNAGGAVDRSDGVDIFGPALLRDSEPVAQGGGQRRNRLGDDLAEHRRAEAAAEHQEVDRAAIDDAGIGSRRDRNDFGPDRVAGAHRLAFVLVPQVGNRLKRRCDTGDAGRQKAVRAAEHGILLMDDGRFAQRGRGEHRGDGGVASESDDREGIDAREDALRLEIAEAELNHRQTAPDDVAATDPRCIDAVGLHAGERAGQRGRPVVGD